MSAARFRSRDEKAMWPIASTMGTMPGFFVMSMCSIVLPRYLDLSADSVALRGLVFSSAMGEAPSHGRGKGTGSGKTKSHRGQLRCVIGWDNRHCGPGWL